MPNTLRDAFSQLSILGKARVLARLIHAETVHARDAYVPGDEAAYGVRLRRHNETVHRLSGRLMALLGEPAPAAHDEYIVGLVERIASSSPRRGEEVERWIAEAATRAADRS